MANANVYTEEPEVYQLPPKPQPKKRASIPDSPLLKPPAPMPPATKDVELLKGELALTTDEATPPPRPPKKSPSSSSTGSSSAGEQSPLTGRKDEKQRSRQSKVKAKSSEKGVHFDPSLPKEEEPPPLPPRSAESGDISVPAGVGSTSHREGRKTPPIPPNLVTVQATMEEETPPPSYSVVVEMEPISDSSEETSSVEGGGNSDCTASTELGHDVISDSGEGNSVRHSSPESAESSC